MTTEHIVRTFKPRRRRVSASRAELLARLGETFVLDERGPPLELATVFGRTSPVALEIGFGYGDATVEIARTCPDVDVIAVDVHTPGIAAVLEAIDTGGLGNVRLVHGDATVFLDRLRPRSLGAVQVWFPDPWPKIRHRHRRLVDAAMVRRFTDLLAIGGTLHLATDIEDYALQMGEACAAEPRLTPAPTPWRPPTRYGAKGEAAGRTATDLAYRRQS